MDHLAITKELAQILRNEHPGYRGDRIANAEHFARTIGEDLPDEAERMVEDIKANVAAFSEETGLPRRSLLIFASNVLAATQIGKPGGWLLQYAISGVWFPLEKRYPTKQDARDAMGLMPWAEVRVTKVS